MYNYTYFKKFFIIYISFYLLLKKLRFNILFMINHRSHSLLLKKFKVFFIENNSRVAYPCFCLSRIYTVSKFYRVKIKISSQLFCCIFTSCICILNPLILISKNLNIKFQKAMKSFYFKKLIIYLSITFLIRYFVNLYVLK